MPSHDASELQRALIIAWGHLSLTKNADAVFSFALLTYHLARDLKDEVLEEMSRSWLTIASEDWLKKSGNSD